MRVSTDWLSDHVDLSGVAPERAAELLLLHTAEVEGIERSGGGWPGVVVALVLGVRPHPNADRLRLVRVRTGDGEAEVVCGAPNVAEGQRVCFAPAGVTLPGGLLLEKRKIRGVESAGMVLSQRELGLGEDHEGILVLDRSATVGAPASDVLGGDAVIEINNTAITARPDLWGHYGVARELAAILERPLRPLEVAGSEAKGAGGIDVAVRDRRLCPRYLGWAIGGVSVAPSPEWLRRRLERVGQRSINNLVDLTNYVMLELGQPLHAFDRRRIAEARIVVRAARKSERVTTLDGQERELPDGACVIADPKRALAVAGVMGLLDSEVKEDTSEIVLEVASFDRAAVRRTAKALGLRTESAVRFEKGTDRDGIPAAAGRFLELLRRVCPGAAPIGPPCDVVAKTPRARPVAFAAGFVARRLGTDVPDERQDAILGRLGFRVERSRSRVKVTVPSWRAAEVTIPEDLVEEIGRIHGYDRIAPAPMRGLLEPVPVDRPRAVRTAVRAALAGAAGLTEIYAYPFTTREECERARVAPPDLGVRASAQTGLEFLAPSLVPALLRALQRNAKYRDEAALFLVAPVFRRREGPGLPNESERLGLAIARRSGGTVALELKGAIEAALEAIGLSGAAIEPVDGGGFLHPGRAGRVVVGGRGLGEFGELAPAVARAWDLPGPAAVGELDLAGLGALEPGPARMEPISRYPAVPFDVAVVVARKTPAAEVEAVLRRADATHVRSVRLFDVYEGPALPPDRKSLAFRVELASLEKTLDTADRERLHERVKRAVRDRGWTLRE